MFPRRAIAAASFGLLLLTAAPATILAGSAAGHVDAIKHYSNCTQMHKDYPHGVGKKGATDHTSGKPVRNFYVSTSLYNANRGSDGDHDGIACEAH